MARCYDNRSRIAESLVAIVKYLQIGSGLVKLVKLILAMFR